MADGVETVILHKGKDYVIVDKDSPQERHFRKLGFKEKKDVPAVGEEKKEETKAVKK